MNQPTRQALVWIVRCIHWFVWPHESYINIAGERALRRDIFSTHLDYAPAAALAPAYKTWLPQRHRGDVDVFKWWETVRRSSYATLRGKNVSDFQFQPVITFNWTKVLLFGQLSSVQYLPAWVMFSFTANTNLSASHVKLIVEIWLFYSRGCN